MPLKLILRTIRRKILELIRFEGKKVALLERVLINQGRLLAQSKSSFQTSGFQVFSQFDEDGTIQFLTSLLEIKNKTFIEFGIEDFSESNCRFLMMKDNWRGFVVDSSRANIARLKESYYFWKSDLTAVEAFIDKDNINEILASCPFDYDLGLLSIDLDSIDFYVLQSIVGWRPRILICEFNPFFGPSRKISVPYDSAFNRYEYHASGIFWGASLAAIDSLATKRGYASVGTNSACQNAFFVREDLLKAPLVRLSPLEAFRRPTIRAAYGQQGRLRNPTFEEAQHEIAGLTVLNTESNLFETI